MVHYYLLLLFLWNPHLAPAQTKPSYTDTTNYPIYRGNDLGLTFNPGNQQGTLRVWAPTAEALSLRLYAAGVGGAPLSAHALRRAHQGTWTLTLPRGTTGFYTVQATIAGQARAEVPDPYVHAVGLNGARGAWLDPATSAPTDWPSDQHPKLNSPTDIVLGELDIRDLSSDPQSGIRHQGKYLGLTEAGTTGPGGVRTGLAHLQELGITHVHLLPTNDFSSIDESLATPPFNWGYDPLHYTVPEGSYATNAADPAVRIREFRQMVQALHQHGLRLVLDVVYNHTTALSRTSFEQLVPGYYYRHTATGSLSDAAGCGNEVASERPMVRKLIVESLLYWAQAYHVDGFRFDLMGGAGPRNHAHRRSGPASPRPLHFPIRRRLDGRQQSPPGHRAGPESQYARPPRRSRFQRRLTRCPERAILQSSAAGLCQRLPWTGRKREIRHCGRYPAPASRVR